MDDKLNCYIILTFAGPFGEMKQVSALMRPSEAAMTGGDYLRRMGDRTQQEQQLCKLIDVRMVRLSGETA